MTARNARGIPLTECVMKPDTAPPVFTVQEITLPVSRIAKVTAFEPPEHMKYGVNLPAAAIELRAPGGHIYVLESRDRVTTRMNDDGTVVMVTASADLGAIERRVVDEVLARGVRQTETGRIPRKDAASTGPREWPEAEHLD